MRLLLSSAVLVSSLIAAHANARGYRVGPNCSWAQANAVYNAKLTAIKAELLGSYAAATSELSQGKRVAYAELKRNSSLPPSQDKSGQKLNGAQKTYLATLEKLVRAYEATTQAAVDVYNQKAAQAYAAVKAYSCN